ncbi:GDP-D-glucose phosphorylase 1-like isoform X2 [Oopsacas minuta]|uniref:GDP-D-glucose phosphorylase 1 n=1 Tax=Oopsacas minuta TaxID=111878 RepID=A0AAV7KFX8_9METZ|nr:GDP-D-glucose phosphorylase 1-like isoform X2 [Oopsacas minuta]
MTVELKWADIEDFDKIIKDLWTKSEYLIWLDLNTIRSRTLIGNYSIVLVDNKGRFETRRKPPTFIKLTQEFSEDGFNFNKIQSKERMLTISHLDMQIPKDNLEIVINVSPIFKYHSLIIPYPLENKPQIMDQFSLRIILDIAMKSADPNMVIIGNSLLAHATVNHLHFHLLYPEFSPACSRAEGDHPFISTCRELIGYFFQGFLMVVTNDNVNAVKSDLVMIIEVLIQKDIPHNIVFCKRHDKATLVLVFPRNSTVHMQKSHGKPCEHKVPFFVAACELAGIIPVTDGFDDLTESDCVSIVKESMLDDIIYKEIIQDIKIIITKASTC